MHACNRGKKQTSFPLHLGGPNLISALKTSSRFPRRRRPSQQHPLPAIHHILVVKISLMHPAIVRILPVGENRGVEQQNRVGPFVGIDVFDDIGGGVEGDEVRREEVAVVEFGVDIVVLVDEEVGAVARGEKDIA